MKKMKLSNLANVELSKKKLSKLKGGTKLNDCVIDCFMYDYEAVTLSKGGNPLP